SHKCTVGLIQPPISTKAAVERLFVNSRLTPAALSRAIPISGKGKPKPCGCGSTSPYGVAWEAGNRHDPSTADLRNLRAQQSRISRPLPGACGADYADLRL